MKKFLPLLGFLLLFTGFTFAQTALDPSDAATLYNAATPPTQPPFGQIGKWVRSTKVSWNTTSFKPYIYKGLVYRIKFPKTYQHNVADGKKYPVFVFFHGRGEGGTIYDNEYQLFHGGQVFSDAVDNGTFDGFLVYPQSTSGTWGNGQFDNVAEFLNIMAANVKADLNRISVNGLSEGGYGSWEFTIRHPELVAAAAPMSGMSTNYLSSVNNFKFTPIWLFQGGLDNAPAPYTSSLMVTAEQNAGGNFKYSLYPSLGHGTWYTAWAESDFFPFINRANMLKPWPLFGRSEFCNGDTINITIGISPGFSGYEWQKNGITISGATTNQINVTSLGVYSVRVKRGTEWSEFSPIPLEVKIKAPTVTPPISTDPLTSNVLPAPDGSTTVALKLPEGYASYQWQRVGNPTVLGTASSYSAGPGSYVAAVTELYGCASNLSAPYTVVSSTGANAPDAVSGLSIVPVSQTSLTLNWTDKANPQYNETAFEVYRSAVTGGPYSLIAKVNSDVLTYTDAGLNSNTTYYYIIRAVNNNGAAPVSAEGSGKTLSDEQAPTPPSNLSVYTSTTSSVTLNWSASTDNIAVTGYDVYVNGTKAYSVDGDKLSAIVYGLSERQVYRFYVVAKDAQGNSSVPSSEITAGTVNKGLSYKYYQGSWSVLPDFNALTPVAAGRIPNVDISPRLQDDNFGFLWQGFITIPVQGDYTFEISSDDGSRFYFNNTYTATTTPTIDNDGLHGTTAKSVTINNVAPGVYPIAATFFEAGGGQVMTLRWKCTQLGISSLQAIPNQYLGDTLSYPGTAPAAPANLKATAAAFNKITLNWADSSNNETGFEIYRSTTNNGTFSIVGKVGANVTTFDDTNVSPNTRYFYKIKAVGQFGASGFGVGYPYAGIWLLNNSYADLSYGNNTMTGSGTTFITPGKEGSHALSFNGTSNYAGIGGSSTGFLHEAFSARTVALWMKADLLTNNRIIFDMGGSDNGLALRINSNKLEVGIASGNSRKTISTTFNSTDWTHVAVVYANGNISLYINGLLAASGSGYASVNTTTNNSRIGLNNSSNAFASNGSYYKGAIDYFTIINQGLTSTEVSQLANNTLPLPTAQTPVLPAAPAKPINVTISNVSANSIQLNWKAADTLANNFVIERSLGTTNTFIVKATVNSGADSIFHYKDTALFANQQYVYRIKANGDGGSSAYTTNVAVTTNNNPPVIEAISNQSARYDVVTHIAVNATDADGDPITYTTANLPSFVTLVQGAGGTYLNVAPSVGLQGTYQNLTVYATDNHSGKDTVRFNLDINDNYTPAIGSTSNISLNEGSTQQVNLSAADQNSSDSLIWTANNLPSFITLTGNNRSAVLNVKPDYADAGTYTVQLQVSDNRGGIDTKSVTITVVDKDPNYMLYVRFKYNTNAPAPWNNVTGKDTYNLINDKGETTSVNLRVQSNFWNTWNEGPTTGNNSGVFPDIVLKEYYFFGAYPGIFTSSNSIDMKLTGLDTTRQYSFKFMAGSKWSVQANNGTTIFTINGVSKPISVQNNTSTTIDFDNIQPDSNGEITFNVSVPAGTKVGYLNGFTVNAALKGNTPPAAPKNLVVTQQNSIVSLNWTNTAYNATGSEVYRSTDSLGTYALLKSIGSATVSSYTDSTGVGNHRYYYKVRAVNSNGNSNFSNISGVLVPSKLPVLDSIADVKVRAEGTLTVNVSSHGDPANTFTLTASGLPSFGTFTDNSNGTGSFTFSPTEDNLGNYQINVTVTDNLGATSQRTFNLNVTDVNTTSVYFNFGNNSAPIGAPWNNILGFPYGNVKTTNALDETGAGSGISMTFGENWEKNNEVQGMTTGENTGVYPDVVMLSTIYDSKDLTHNIKIGGLAANKLYNFVFFNSVNFGVNGSTNFTINGNTLTLNPSYNTSKTLQINGIAPNSNGEVNIQISKNGGKYLYLNAMVIESYDNTLAIVNPLGLTAASNEARQISLNWADRSNNETGFEIYRAVSGGGYTKIATVGANVTSFTDGGLSVNTKYYYKVKAINATDQSDFSNMSAATTLSYKVLVNFSELKSGPLPWNNTLTRPQLGVIASNLNDTENGQTGIGVDITTNFDGMYSAGAVTGNNSGVYPDNVILENYGLFPGNHGSFNLTGLNQTLRYNLVFFGSSVEYADVTTKYTVNGTRATYLNTSLNQNGTITMYNVAPDQDGKIKIDVDPGTATSRYGLISALTIQAHVDPATQQEAGPVSNNLQRLANNKVMVSAPIITKGSEATELLSNVNVYPNPFTTQINVNAEVQKDTPLKLEIFDISGRLVYSEFKSNVSKGTITLRLATNGKIQAPGIYIMRITGKSGTPKVVKLIKQ